MKGNILISQRWVRHKGMESFDKNQQGSTQEPKRSPFSTLILTKRNNSNSFPHIGFFTDLDQLEQSGPSFF